MKSLRKVLHSMVVASAVVVTGLSDVTRAADLAISPVPLFLGGNTQPNIMFTLDDSGSMHWETLPESVAELPTSRGTFGEYLTRMFPMVVTGVYGGSGNAPNNVPDFDGTNKYSTYARSYYNNTLYYNPSITYIPWSNADGTLFVPAVPAAAYHNPRLPAKGFRILDSNNTQSARWLQSNKTYTSSTTSKTFYPATYFRYNGGDVWTPANYTKVEIKSANGPFTGEGRGNRSDCTAGSCTYLQEIQNFANWYTYYRSRVLAARAGAGRAFASQSGGLRVGFAAINTAGPVTVDGVSSPGTLVRGVRNFSGTDRTNFFNDLYDHVIPYSGTPLRRALDDIGQYFSRTDNAGPWGEKPGFNDTTPQLACRQSYNILMTDGYWNSVATSPPRNAALTTAAQANVDGTAGPLITNHSNPPVPLSYSYAPVTPYKDGWYHSNPTGGTLADVAMYYWNRDLRTNLLNKVPTNSRDPAFWQHMVTFTVGLGVFGTLNPTTDLFALPAGTDPWPKPFDGAAGENIDDLWHAAVNGRGDFFSASNPDEFAQGLSASLANISGRAGSASSIALNSTSLRAGSSVYQARFNSADWSGQLLSIPIAFGLVGIPDGTLLPEEWDAAEKLAGQDYDTRKIVTFKPLTRKGAPFRWLDIDALQSSALNINPQTLIPDVPTPRGSERLDYLRGKDVAGMRVRAKKLGDIVHSSPAFVGAPIFRYPDSLETIKYADFKTAKKNRKPLVYAGANDGMLHAFDASSGPERGTEVFAYVPAAVYKNLNQLTNPTYTHRFFVDGAPTVGDAFFGGSWHTVLVGGLRAGGQAIYALDITDPPGSDNETAIAAKVLWEFNDVEGLYGDKDLGYTFSEPNIVRMKNGKWAAVFGNGYNNTEADDKGACTDSDPLTPCTVSTTGNAVLYIVDLETGALIKKIDTGVGKAQDPKNTTAANQLPNGLATPAPIDNDGDSIVDYIYAGDLFGNLWKFDVDWPDTNDWKVLGFSGGPLFVACAGTGTQCTTAGVSNLRQPITTRPQVGRHPTKANGFMVYFGTGKYIEGPDIDAKPTGQSTQTFYGVWDENQSSPSATLYRKTPSNQPVLLEQMIVKEVKQGFDTNGDGTNDDFFDLRVTTDNPINWDTPAFHKGWYMDLINTGASPLDNQGERQVTDSILRNDRIIFTTLIPSADPCDFGGTGWLMEIDAKDGSRLEFSPFDLNADGTFDGKDHVTLAVDINGDGVLDPVPPGGKKSKVGIPPTPGVVSDSSDPNTPPKELKYTSGSTGKIEVTTENPGSGNVGRRSWRELYLQ